MLNDRDDKYEGHEESEYHFSDEEVSYEVETETPKQEPAPKAAEPKESMLNRLSGSKRMLITGVVFLVLIFVVYKMVSPTSTTPPTEITPTIAQTTPTQMSPTVAANSKQPTAMAATPSAAAPPANAMAQANQPAAPVQTPPAAPVMAIQTPVVTPPGQPAVTAPTPAVQPTQQAAPAQPSMLTGLPSGGEVVTTEQQPQEQNVAVAPGMPSVIPVQSAMPTQNTAAPLGAQMPASSEANSMAMQANSEKLMTQMQAEYTQKLNEYQTQNKVLQDQVSTLNNRVATMESQLTELVKALTKQMQASAGAPDAGMQGPASYESGAGSARESYNVQAIIPGRAWLKSESGETVTVAEGDVIRGLGRITKIDPYDGIVEINTGNKVISLSYGNGG